MNLECVCIVRGFNITSNDPRHEKTCVLQLSLAILHMRKQRRRSASKVQSLYFVNPKFQASSYLLLLYSLVCVAPGRIPRRPIFSERGSI